MIYLIEDKVLSVQSVYMHTADNVLKKVRKCKANNKVCKKTMIQQSVLNKRKELRFITKALNWNSNDSRLRQRFCNLKKHRSLCRKRKHKHEQELLCKFKQLHHTDTESLWKLLRQVKGDKGQALQNQHELPSLENSLNYLRHFSRNKHINLYSSKISETLKHWMGVQQDQVFIS